jgi:hypothetical protein
MRLPIHMGIVLEYKTKCYTFCYTLKPQKKMIDDGLMADLCVIKLKKTFKRKKSFQKRSNISKQKTMNAWLLIQNWLWNRFACHVRIKILVSRMYTSLTTRWSNKNMVQNIENILSFVFYCYCKEAGLHGNKFLKLSFNQIFGNFLTCNSYFGKIKWPLFMFNITMHILFFKGLCVFMTHCFSIAPIILNYTIYLIM